MRKYKLLARRQIISYLVWACIFIPFYVQAFELDSLKRKLVYTVSDTNKVWLLRDIAYYYKWIDSDSALHYSQRGYVLAKSLGFPDGQIWNLYQKALAHEYKNDFEASYAIYKYALQIASDYKDHVSRAKLYNALGVAHYFAGSFHLATEYYQRSYSLSDSLVYYEGLTHALNNLGVIYRLQRRFDKALEMYSKSLDIKMFEKDSIGIVNSLYNMGLAYSYLHEYDESQASFLEAQKIALEINDTDHVDLANIQIGLGVALYNLNDIVAAERHLLKGLQEINHVGSHDWISGMTYLGAIDVLKNKTTEGLIKIEQAYEHAIASGRLELVRQVLKERALAASAAGNYPLAIKSWQDYTQVSDSLHAEKKLWIQQEMLAKFEIYDKQMTISMQHLQLEEQGKRTRLYFFVGISLFVLLIISVAFLWLNRRQQRQLKKAVAIKQSILKENEMLLQEMHHRTKNNLQLLDSLLTLQSMKTFNGEARQLLQHSRNSVGAIGLLHQQLYRSADFRVVAMQTFVEDLTNYCHDAYALEERGIKICCQCDELDMDIDKAIPLGLVMNELITNAIKHAFGESGSGEVFVCLKKEEMHIRLEVSDNGKTLNGSPLPDGMGKKMITLLGEKLKAEIKYLHLDTGSHVRFQMPL